MQIKKIRRNKIDMNIRQHAIKGETFSSSALHRLCESTVFISQIYAAAAEIEAAAKA